MPNISGNFDTYADEIEAVRFYLRRMGYNPDRCSVTKFGGNQESDMAVMSATDVTVKLPDNRTLLFEVKQESYYRFSRWGQLGVDFISVFDFKPGMNFDRRPHYPRDFRRFIDTVDVDGRRFKWGKLNYSTADVWLFYCKDPDGSYCFCEGYDYDRMRRDNITTYFKNNCQFAVNSKNASQMSYTDTWQSAVFFVDPEQIEEYLLTPQSFARLKDFNSLIF